MLKAILLRLSLATGRVPNVTPIGKFVKRVNVFVDVAWACVAKTCVARLAFNPVLS